MSGRLTPEEWDEYVRANFDTIPQAEVWRNANNVSVEGMPEPTYTGGLSQGSASMDPEDEADMPPAGALPFKSVGEWAQGMQGLSAEQAAYGRQQDTERKQQYEAARKALEERRMGPSEAERWYALSAAIGTPMIRPSFGGVMRNVTSSLADFNKAKREAETSRADALAALRRSYEGDNDEAKMAEFKARREAMSAVGPVLARMARPTGSYSATPAGVIFDRTTGNPKPTAMHIDALLKNPVMARDFDIKFGPGEAEKYLSMYGGNKP